MTSSSAPTGHALMSTLRTDFLILALSIAVMLIVRFWAALAGTELLGLVTVLRLAVGDAILGAVVGVWSARVRSALALALGVSIATVIASIFTRGALDPEAAVGAALIAVAVALGSYVVIRRVADWVRGQPRAIQVLLVAVGATVAVALVVAVATAR